jgi:hypothetical protein
MINDQAASREYSIDQSIRVKREEEHRKEEEEEDADLVLQGYHSGVRINNADGERI